MKQYLRKWELYIGGELYIEAKPDANFRVVFDVYVSPGNANVTADIRVYNLKDTGAIKQGANIELLAGYEDNFGTIFQGTITNTFKEREGADIATRMLCRSGAGIQSRGSIEASYTSSASIIDVLQDIAKAWPLAIDIDAAQFADAARFPSGYVLSGDLPQALDKLSKQFDFQWCEDRGNLVISKVDKERSGNVFDIGPMTGMVGIPEVGLGPNGLGVTVITRINPAIRSTSRFEVKSRFSTYNTGDLTIVPLEENLSANGIYNVFSMHWSGDSYSDEWNLRLEGLRPGTQPSPETVAAGALVWGQRTPEQSFRTGVKEMAQRQGLDPNWYMASMAFETGGTFNPAIKNSAGSGATGLIQFMPSTAVGLGTTTQALALMTRTEQLKYVEAYIKPYASRIQSLSDFYMAILWPLAVGKADDFVLWTKDGQYATQYRQNNGLDKNGDGKITKAEAASRVIESLKTGANFAK